MPAVTVDDLTLIEHLSEDVSTTGVQRAVKSVTTAPAGFEGEGFPVRRAFAGVSMADLDPFVHMDQMGEIEYAPGEPKGTPWHPHRGFETVTYMIDGTFLHQDSHGGGGVIRDGGTQWMTAGSGILHIETPPEQLVVDGGLFHGIQLWVNLPPEDKMISPAYQGIEADMVKLIASADGASLLRVVAGDIGGSTGPGSTHSPMAFVHATIQAGSEVRVPWSPDFNALVYVLAGSGSIGADRVPVRTGQLAVLGAGDWFSVRSEGDRVDASEALEVLFLGGRPIGAPVVHYGPFVMNTRAQIEQALEDFRAGKLGTVPAGALQPFRTN